MNELYHLNETETDEHDVYEYYDPHNGYEYYDDNPQGYMNDEVDPNQEFVVELSDYQNEDRY